jgi:hypothetical protein
MHEEYKRDIPRPIPQPCYCVFNLEVDNWVWICPIKNWSVGLGILYVPETGSRRRNGHPATPISRPPILFNTVCLQSGSLVLPMEDNPILACLEAV